MIEKEKKLWASLFMMLLIASPYTVLSDDSFCTKTWVDFGFGSFSGFAGANDGSLYSWGVNQFGQLGYGYAGQIQSVPAQVNPSGPIFVAAAGSEYHMLAIAANGSAYGWGSNTYGNLGPIVAVGGIQLTPKRINTLGVVSYVASHVLIYTSYAIKAAGTLFAFGQNTHGQLGKPAANLAQTATPQKIGTATDWDSVFPAYRDAHVCAKRTNGNLYCWGENYYGQVGDGSTTDRHTPKLIGTAADNWTAVYPVQYATLALHSNGTLWGWGTTFWGLFGDGSDYSQSKTPKLLAGGQTFKSVAVADTFVIAIGTNGRLYGWGDNRFNQANSAGAGIQNTKNQIASGTNWDKAYVSYAIQMAAVGSAFATKTNGNLFAWGLNDNGQLGLGSAAAVVSTPTLVTGVEGDIVRVYSAGYSTGILNHKGELFYTGFNNFNLLGDGTVLPSNAFHSCTDRSQKCVNHVCQNRLLRF